jgi:hypothetical protein
VHPIDLCRWLPAAIATGVLVSMAAVVSVGPGALPALAQSVQLTPSVQEARARVDYHLREVDQIARHFQGVVNADCPRFSSRGEWRQYFDIEVERMTLLLAHLEQAWVEAKQVGDDGVRRAAKAPRRRIEEARVVLEKLQTCAADNGASFSPLSVWSRIEREAPKRQEAIVLPR